MNDDSRILDNIRTLIVSELSRIELSQYTESSLVQKNAYKKILSSMGITDEGIEEVIRTIKRNAEIITSINEQ